MNMRVLEGESKGQGGKAAWEDNETLLDIMKIKSKHVNMDADHLMQLHLECFWLP